MNKNEFLFSVHFVRHFENSKTHFQDFAREVVRETHGGGGGVETKSFQKCAEIFSA